MQCTGKQQKIEQTTFSVNYHGEQLNEAKKTTVDNVVQ